MCLQLGSLGRGGLFLSRLRGEGMPWRFDHMGDDNGAELGGDNSVRVRLVEGTLGDNGVAVGLLLLLGKTSRGVARDVRLGSLRGVPDNSSAASEGVTERREIQGARCRVR